MPIVSNDIEFVVGRGFPFDPDPGTFQYRNPILKNRRYRPYLQGLGPLLSNQYEQVNEVTNDDYGFNVYSAFVSGQNWLLAFLPGEVESSITGEESLIDHTYFIRNIFIPNINSELVQNILSGFINKCEKEILKHLLGLSLYRIVLESLSLDPIPERIQKLLSGTIYLDENGVEHEWVGFVNPQKQSLIANFVYYEFSFSNNTQTTGNGESVSKSEAAFRTSPNAKMIAAWSEMVEWIRDLVCFLQIQCDTYPEWKSHSIPDKYLQKINWAGL